MAFQNGHKFYKGGEKNWFKKDHKIRVGMKHRPDTIEKISKAKMGHKGFWKGKNGKLAFAWKGGKSFEPYTVDWTETLRRAIRERDNYICKMCGQQQGDFVFDVHHIDYDKKNCNLDNLITLCRKCHSKTNFNRKKWLDYFQKTIISLFIIMGVFFANPFEVRADTFGYETIGGTSASIISDDANGSLFTSPANIGIVNSITSYVGGATSDQIKGLVILHTDLTIITNGIGGALNIGTVGWRTSNFSTPPSPSALTEYVLMIINSGGITVYRDTGSTNQSHIDTVNDFVSPQDLGTITHTDNVYSIYAAYTPSGDGITNPAGTLKVLNGKLNAFSNLWIR